MEIIEIGQPNQNFVTNLPQLEYCKNYLYIKSM